MSLYHDRRSDRRLLTEATLRQPSPDKQTQLTVTHINVAKTKLPNSKSSSVN
jgi:hypothetical protein